MVARQSWYHDDSRSSLMAPKVAISTACCASSDDKVGFKAILDSVQDTKDYKLMQRKYFQLKLIIQLIVGFRR